MVVAVLLAFPTVGALAAWVVALRGWRESRGQVPSGSEGREARVRVIPLMVLPTTLIVFGLVLFFLVLGETLPDAVALPAALAYGVPGLLTGLGMALVYRRGIVAAAVSKRGFGRVLPLATMPETAAVFGLVASLLLIGGATNPASVEACGADAAWLASALVMVGGIGGPVGAWLAVSSWDFKTKETWARANARGARGGYLTVACFALGMAVLGQWLIVLLLALYLGGVLAFGLALFRRARRKRSGGTKAA